jgi:hypothetical protein
LLISLTITGCAKYGEIELTYVPINLSSGKQGELFIEMPRDESHYRYSKNGFLVIGEMGWQDVVTSSSPADWVVYAYAKELALAGYNVKTVEIIPDYAEKGLQFTLKHVYADSDIGLFTSGVIAQVKYDIMVWRNGVKVGTLQVEGKDQARSIPLTIKHYGLATRAALTDGVKRSLPNVVRLIDE